MHIFIDARGLENNVDGIGQFTLHILKRLSQFSTTRFSVLIRDDLRDSLQTAGNIDYIKTNIRRFTIGEGYKIKRLITVSKPDLYLNISPYLSGNFPCKRYLIIHDLLSTHFKGHFKGMGILKGFLAKQYFRYKTAESVARADGIITVSQHSKTKICRYYKFDKLKIAVVYGGVDEQFDYCPDDKKKREFIHRHGLTKDFFLHVGNLKPYKNITNIIKAYADFVKKYPDSHKELVLTGNCGRGYRCTIDLIDSLQLRDKIKVLGYIDVIEMPFLYNLSCGLFFPSLEEGGGLPVLEAMRCKIPVVTSKGTATEELAGGHAFLVNPRSIDSLVEGLEYLAFSAKDVNKINAAYAHAKEFTWDKTVSNIMRIIMEK
jgi:glycosyltransferase involved in cell wall biosynthesis